jgi:phosphatidylglycerol:prolipoprotein diacylglycerol transferase
MLIDPVVHRPFEIPLGPIPITGYGIAVAAAFFMGQYIAQRELGRRGHDPSPMSDVFIAAVLGYLVGGKLYYVALHPSWESLTSRSGVVFWGGLMGGILFSWIAMRRRGTPFLRMADVAAPGIAAGYAIGRTGCWAVGDDYGRPWDSHFAVVFPQGLPPSLAPVHPTQLYETAMGFVMFAILWRMRDHRHAEGWLFGVYCVLAGVERFIVEFYRAKDDRFFGPFTSAQLVALGFIIAGAAVLAARRQTGPGKPGIMATQS